MGANLLDFSHALETRRTAHLFDEFNSYTDLALWTKLTVAAGSSCAVGDNIGGRLVITTGAVNNNEAAVFTTKNLFLTQANKPCLVESCLQYTEGNVNVANIAFGLFSSPGSNVLLDNGAGPAANFSGFLIYKVDGSTVWKCVSSNGTTQILSTSTATAGTASLFQTLRIEIKPVNSTIAEITFFVDNACLLDSTSLKQIKHQYTYTSQSKMSVVHYAKAGDATGEVLNVDYTAADMLR